MSKIKAGFRLSCFTWENDLDSPQTIIVDGLKEDFLKELCQILSHYIDNQKWDPKIGTVYDPNYWGNQYDSGEIILGNMLSEIKKLPIIMEMLNLSDEFKQDFSEMEEDNDFWTEYDNHADEFVDKWQNFISDYMGCSDRFSRVLDTVKIEYVPEEINLEEYTEKFFPNFKFHTQIR